MLPAQYSMLRVELLSELMPYLLGLAGCVAATIQSTRWLIARRHRIGADADSGTTELEFAIALPFFLVSVLTTVQIALMVNANLIVDYAAFCAARSAAVWLPQNTPGEPPNVISADPKSGSPKWNRITRAAILAVMPVSPRLTGFRFGITFPPDAMTIDGPTLGALAAQADVPADQPVNWLRLGLDTVNKSAYARWFTDVDLVDGQGRAQRQFGGDVGTVTARVTHKFEMAVPFAGPLMGSVFGRRYIPIIGGYYVPISAAYTLVVAHS